MSSSTDQPNGTPLSADVSDPAMRPPTIRRTHLAVFVRDPETSAKWYEQVLGMQVTARGPEWVFLSFGRKHHDIALIRAQDEATLSGIGLQHYGLEIEGDVEEFHRLYDRLVALDVDIVKVSDHKVGYGVYFTDPDGNRFEFFYETIADDDLGKRVLGYYGAPSIPTEIDSIDAEVVELNVAESTAAVNPDPAIATKETS